MDEETKKALFGLIIITLISFSVGFLFGYDLGYEDRTVLVCSVDIFCEGQSLELKDPLCQVCKEFRSIELHRESLRGYDEDG